MNFSLSKAKLAGFVGSLGLFLVCLVVVVFVYSPVDRRAELDTSKVRVAGNSRVFLCSDPPGAMIKVSARQDSSWAEVALTGSPEPVAIEELKPYNGTVTFTLSKNGYKERTFTVPVNLLKQGVWPPLSEQVVVLEPESFWKGATMRHPFALALCGLGVVGIGLLGFALLGEYRGLKELEALKAENLDDPYVATRVSEYRVGRMLGKGGYGAVYVAHADGNLKKSDFAMKIAEYTGVNPALDQELKERFEREMYLLKDLAHPNIGRVIDFSSTKTFSWVLMPLYTGGELEHRIAEGNLSQDEILYFARGIASGLSMAHSKGICHRDLKPANVMLHHGEPVIIDFGLARAVDSKTLTMEGAMMGTPIYMSQEQLMDSKSVTFKTDQYAYGVMLFEMLTGGKLPFESPKEGGEIMALVQEKLVNCAKPIREIDPTQSAEVEEVLARMMASDAVDRYDSIMDAYQAFEKAYRF